MTFAKAVERTAELWRNPGYSSRALAVRHTMQAENRFTEEALAFAIDHEMRQVTAESLTSWIAERVAKEPCSVGVLNPGNVPLAGFQDFLAVLMSGNHYVGACSTRSPRLLPAFAHDLKK